MPGIYTGVKEEKTDREANEKAISDLKDQLRKQIEISLQISGAVFKELIE